MRFWLGLVLVCILSPVRAQSERHGVRVHYTSLGSAGGLEGRAFLPVSTQGVAENAPTSACPGVRRLNIQAALTRGPLRGLRLDVPSTKNGRVLLSAACDGAAIEAKLEDGSLLNGGRGYIEVQSEPSAADGTFRGTFALTTDLRGVPLTLEGSFVVPRAKTPPIP